MNDRDFNGMRAIALSLASAVLVMLFAACGDNRTDTTATSAPAATAVPTATTAPEPTPTPTATPAATATPTPPPAFPVTLDQFLGPITIEERSERVYVVDAWGVDLVTSLGVTPVGVAMYYPPTAFMSRLEVENTEVTLITEGLPIETIAATDPYLIIDASGFFSQLDSDVYQLLTEIAPVLSPPDDYLVSRWRDRYRHVAAALGLSERAEELIAQAETRVQELQDQFPTLKRASVTFARFNGVGATFDIIVDDSDFTRDFLNQEFSFVTPQAQLDAVAAGTVEMVGGAIF